MCEKSGDLKNEETLSYYRDMYFMEKEKNERLTRELTDLEAEHAELT